MTLLPKLSFVSQLFLYYYYYFIFPGGSTSVVVKSSRSTPWPFQRGRGERFRM